MEPNSIAAMIAALMQHSQGPALSQQKQGMRDYDALQAQRQGMQALAAGQPMPQGGPPMNNGPIPVFRPGVPNLTWGNGQ